jgi:Na+/H+-dicarboxylate symporter
MKKLALHWQIIIGMILGVLFGLLFLNFEWGKTFVLNWIKPFGTIFINSLKLIAVPLILASLIKGISDLKDLSKLSSMGGITIATYIFTTMMAVSIGLVAVNIIEPGNFIAEETREQLVNAYSLNANEKIEAANSQKSLGPLQPIVDMVPSNFFSAASNNRNMLQVIFFAIIFGISMILIPEKKSNPIKSFFDSLNDVILKIIDLIMLCAPYGVFALLAAIIVESPSMDLFKALGFYTLTVLFGLLLLICIYLVVVKSGYWKKSFLFFKRNISSTITSFFHEF